MKIKEFRKRGIAVFTAIIFMIMSGNGFAVSAAEVQTDGESILENGVESDEKNDETTDEGEEVEEEKSETELTDVVKDVEDAEKGDEIEETDSIIAGAAEDVASFTAAASARSANRTQAEALQWVKSKVGQSIDADGAYGAQCVDLILAYYDYLGVPRASGNGSNYTSNTLPSGWNRIQGATPQPGDILVYTGGYGGYGHVAIFESANSTYHQNFDGHSYVERITYSYNGLSTPYWGVIRPSWYTAPQPANLGDDFCAIILNRDIWKPIQNTGSNVELCTERNVANEKWLFRRQSDGTYIITSCYDNKVLDVTAAGTVDFTNVGVYPQWGTDNGAQRWYIYKMADDNRWKFVPKLATNMCLDVLNGWTDDGTNIQIYTQNNSSAQQFAIYKIESRRTAWNGVSISTERTEAEVGEFIQLKAVFDPVDTVYNTVRWTSNDESIATVDANGKVTAKSAGTVIIGCNNTFNSNLGTSITLTIRRKQVIEEGWKKNSTGWWYQNADGTYPKNSWKKIGDKWYHFDIKGYMQTNWLKVGNNWYYLGTTGAMQTGWQKIGNSWYYFNSSGIMAANQWISNKYYVKSNGVMAVNEWIDDKHYVDGNGALVPGKIKVTEGWKKNSTGWWYQNADGTYPKNSWKKVGDKWYHFDAKGYMQTNWLKVGNNWYYLGTTGAMQTGWQKIGNNWYYFNGSGIMAVNQWISNKYYVKSNGVMAINEWIDDKHYVDSNGALVPGKVKVTEGWKKNSTGWWYQNADGTYPKNSWKKIGNYWYHFNVNGYMQTGWLAVGSKWYYLDSSGRMVTNQWVQGKYYMKADGTMARDEWIGNYHVDKDGKWDATKS